MNDDEYRAAERARKRSRLSEATDKVRVELERQDALGVRDLDGIVEVVAMVIAPSALPDRYR